MYQTKRQKITNYIKSILNSLKNNESKSASKIPVIANCSIDLGVSEREVEEVLFTFEKAGLLEIKDDNILV